MHHQVHFANYNDKEDVLRKAKLLKGLGVHISEDFSRKVREHRQELNKFMKEIRARDPARRMFLRSDPTHPPPHHHSQGVNNIV